MADVGVREIETPKQALSPEEAAGQLEGLVKHFEQTEEVDQKAVEAFIQRADKIWKGVVEDEDQKQLVNSAIAQEARTLASSYENRRVGMTNRDAENRVRDVRDPSRWPTALIVANGGSRIGIPPETYRRHFLENAPVTIQFLRNLKLPPQRSSLD